MHKTGAVTFNIPQGQSFESTSITGFKGIQYSDNPLAVDQNSAADMLNVYLSDSGTLTTRPRIEYEKGKPSANWDEVINRIKLADDLVLYQVKEVEVVDNQSVDKINLYKYSGTTLTKIDLQGVIISSNKISAFYKDEKIYVLDSKYYVIKSDNKLYLVENDSETHIPVLKINNENTTNKNNILIDKYKNKYSFSLDSSVSDDLYSSSIVDFKNDYYEELVEIEPDWKTEDLTHPFRTNNGWIIVHYSHDEQHNRTNVSVKKISISDTGEKSISDYTNILSDAIVLNVSSNGQHILYQDYNYSTHVYGTVNLYDLNVGNKRLDIHNPEAGVTPGAVQKVFDNLSGVNSNGDVVFVTYNATESVDNPANYMTFGYDILDFDSTKLIYETKEFIQMKTAEKELEMDELRLFQNYDGTKFTLEAIDKGVVSFHNITVTTKDSHKMLDGKVIFDSSYNTGKDLIYTEASPNLNYYARISNDLATISVLEPSLNAEFKHDLINVFDDVSLESVDSFVVLDSGNILISTDKGLYFARRNEIPAKILYFENQTANNFQINQFNISIIDFFSALVENNVVKIELFYYLSKIEPSITITFKKTRDAAKNDTVFNNYFRFQNNYWFYGNGNRLWRTSLNDPTYIEEDNYIDVGNDDRITGINVISDNLIAAYKDNSFYLITRTEISDGNYVYTCTETKGEVGNLPIGQTITTKYSELPLSIDDSGIFYISQLKNVTLSEHNTTSVSSLIDKKFLAEPNKKSIITHNHRYWTYFIFPGNIAKVYVYDNRTNEWYYWELPNGNIISLWEENETADNGDMFIVTKYMTSDGKTYALRTTDKIVRIDADNEDDYYSVYLDSFSNGTQEIEWFWESQILPLTYTRYSKSYPALGYRKQLTQTGFLFTDTDENEEYSLDYSFKVYRKALSTVPEQSISGTLNRVRSILRKTYIPRINFLQVKIKNSDLSYIHQTNLPNTHNKLNLIQLKFKYKLMEETV